MIHIPREVLRNLSTKDRKLFENYAATEDFCEDLRQSLTSVRKHKKQLLRQIVPSVIARDKLRVKLQCYVKMIEAKIKHQWAFAPQLSPLNDGKRKRRQ